MNASLLTNVTKSIYYINNILEGKIGQKKVTIKLIKLYDNIEVKNLLSELYNIYNLKKIFTEDSRQINSNFIILCS